MNKEKIMNTVRLARAEVGSLLIGHEKDDYKNRITNAWDLLDDIVYFVNENLQDKPERKTY